MGQQQLLLVVVGIIIIGTAISVGLTQFNSIAEDANRDAIVNDISHIVGDASSYFVRPAAMGGGSGSFTGYHLPYRLSETGNATYEAEGNGNQLIVIGTSVINHKVIVTLTLMRSENGWDYIWLWEHEGS
jgi:hypothetical protein